MASPYKQEVHHKNDQRYQFGVKMMAEAREEIGETHIENKHYARLVTDWIRCNSMFIEDL